MKKLSVWEASCIITGYGIGAGVLAMPYLAQKNGLVLSFLLLIAAFIASWVMHAMIASICLRCGAGTQIVGVFSRFLFRGRWKTPLTLLFFLLMGVVLVTNLAAYVTGAAEILTGLLPLPEWVCKVLFYLLAASVVIFGLKVVGVSEKIAVTVIFALVAVLAVASCFAQGHPLPMAATGGREALSFFAMAMFAFSAFFSIPQAVEGLEGDPVKVKKAVFIGLFSNFLLMSVILLSALYASGQVTEVAMTGWSAGIGYWAQLVGGVFTVLAMLTTYWSVSLALAGMVREQLRLDARLSWLLATLPSLVLSLCRLGGFIDFLQLAGGAIAIIVAVMVVPTFRNARRELPGASVSAFEGTAAQIFVALSYILMGVGSLL